MSIELLFLSQIRQDGGTQPRGALNEETVLEYAAQMENPSIEFPPVKVVYDGESYWLYDGFHRIAAAAEAGIGQFRAEVLQGTCQDAQWLSFSANQTHGLRRTNADKRRAVEAALRHERSKMLSDGAIAEHVGVSQPFVSSVRRELTQNGFESRDGADIRTGRDGRKLNVAKIGTAPKIEYFNRFDDERVVVAEELEWGYGKRKASARIHAVCLKEGAWFASYEYSTGLPAGASFPLSTEYQFESREVAVRAAAVRAIEHLDDVAVFPHQRGAWPDVSLRNDLWLVRQFFGAIAKEDAMPPFWEEFKNGSPKAKAADEWPEAEDGLFPEDDVKLAVTVDGPDQEWVAIEALQVGPVAWVARYKFDSSCLAHTESLSCEPIHATEEDAIADASLRGGLYLDSLAEQGKLPKGKGDMAELRWVRWQFAEHAGQATLDLDIWDEPKETPAPAPTVAQKLKKDPRLAEMEEAVRCITFLAGVTDWRALGGLAGYAHDGALLLGQVGCAKRNLTHFVKGLEAR